MRNSKKNLTFTVGEGILSNRDFLLQIAELSQHFDIVKDKKDVFYYNIPAAFDIENSSFYINGEKQGCMYVWQFGIWNLVTTGRTWEQFENLLSILRKILGISENLKMLIYVHNLAHEFQFMKKRFDWKKVFLLDERKPVYADFYGFEFRCSLKLSGGKSLANVAKDLIKYKVRKMVGDLDYEKVRGPTTQLTELEMKYCENDIRVLLCYIMEKIEIDGSVLKIPLTNTGYVRIHCRKRCFSRYEKYRELMNELQVEPEEYSQLKRAFQGGFVHANYHYVGKTIRNVGSHDFNSSYPGVMVLERFPMSKQYTVEGDAITEKTFEYLLRTKCCIFELEMLDVIPRLFNEHPLSSSKCYIKQGVTEDNGRVVTADRVVTTVTEQDFFIYREFYDFEYRIYKFRYYEKSYLPKNLVLAILDLYKKKTSLKANDNEEVNYMLSKNMLNASFGMMVTDIVRKQFEYRNGNDTSIKLDTDAEKAIALYNRNKNRFLFYPWGIWVTAYARANLFSGIIQVGNDYVYSDTDSIKSINTQDHEDYFSKYNEEILRKINKSAKFHSISETEFSPLDHNGEKRYIGAWDYEGEYELFKTIGAKRYLFKSSKGHVLTASGVHKVKALEYIMNQGNPFELFDDRLIIPSTNSGRIIVTYIDHEISGVAVDYTGQEFDYHEMSALHMEPSDYNFSISEAFQRFLRGERDVSE